MNHPSLLIVSFAVTLSGCWTAGIGASIDSNAQALATAELGTHVDFGAVRTGAVARLRASPQYLGAGLGWEGCIRDHGLNVPKYCARLYAFELARDQGEPRHSIASPAIGIEWWQLMKQPIVPEASPLGLTTGNAIEANLWL